MCSIQISEVPDQIEVMSIKTGLLLRPTLCFFHPVLQTRKHTEVFCEVHSLAL